MTRAELLLQTEAQFNQALAIAKIYIDRGDAAAKSYADAKLAEILQTTDLNAKLALLQQINGILDGDEATAGFQAWQNSVTTLTDLGTRLNTSEVDIATLQTALSTAQNNLTAAQTALNARIEDAVTTLNTTINTKDTATNARIDGLQASIAADKIAQVEKDATQSASIAANQAAISSVVSSLQAEASERATADSAFNTRVTANETTINQMQAASAEFMTRAQFVEGMTRMVAAATSVFGINPDGTSVSGTSGLV